MTTRAKVRRRDAAKKVNSIQFWLDIFNDDWQALTNNVKKPSLFYLPGPNFSSTQWYLLQYDLTSSSMSTLFSWPVISLRYGGIKWNGYGRKSSRPEGHPDNSHCLRFFECPLSSSSSLYILFWYLFQSLFNFSYLHFDVFYSVRFEGRFKLVLKSSIFSVIIIVTIIVWILIMILVFGRWFFCIFLFSHSRPLSFLTVIIPIDRVELKESFQVDGPAFSFDYSLQAIQYFHLFLGFLIDQYSTQMTRPPQANKYLAL